MNLFTREEAPFIADVVQHAGNYRGITDGLKCWEIRDPKQEPFKDILEAVCLGVSRCHAIPRSTLVLIDIFLRGKTIECSAAYVMLSGATKRHRKTAVRHLRRSDLLRQYPGLKVDQWDWPPQAPNITMTGKGEAPDKNLLYRSPNFDIRRLASGLAEDTNHVPNGSLLSIVTTNDGEEASRAGTLSCVVMVGQDDFFFAPAHIFMPRPPEEPEEDVDMEDSEPDCGFEMLRTGSATPSDLRSNSETTSDDIVQEGVSGGSSTLGGAERPNLTQPSPTTEGFEIFSPEHDYALIPVPQGETFHQELCCISKEIVERIDAGQFAVSVMTPSRGLMNGWLDGRPTLMRLPYSSRFTQFYPINFPDAVSEGDCGSLVIDQNTKQIYGFIVAASIEGRVAYIVSADEILQDITARLGKECGRGQPLESMAFADRHKKMHLSGIVPTGGYNMKTANMAPHTERSQLKRPRASLLETETKKARRSDRLSLNAADKTLLVNKQHLPSPVTHPATKDSSSAFKEPPTMLLGSRPEEVTLKKTKDALSQGQALSSPPQDTQPLSQYPDRHPAISEEIEDEVHEGVWGYLVPLDPKYGEKPIVLKKRTACPLPETIADAAKTDPNPSKGKATPLKDEETFEKKKVKGTSSGGYLIGRHPDCDIVVNDGIVSNRHCLIFAENKGSDTVAIVEDLSSNGTYINEAIVGRNQRRELEEQDEIAVHGKARFVFRYPKSRQTSTFKQQYTLLEKLGKGHFAEVYLCIEKLTGMRYAVKIFTKHPGMEDQFKMEGLQQEIGVLMGVSHPNVLCLKDTFYERDRVYLVLELAPEGDLFNYIVMKQKLSEDETRKLFLQLFQGIKYLHERNIVHRDIKPGNILLVDKNLHVKLADFGLAKIIGEESFITTLCGTPSYIAPEVLADSKQHKYTKAVDIWSLGVVLYICLCGFPPFSDELYSRDFPFTLSQQIKSGRFDYPSPYWDSVGDPALDLIDSMLIVDPEKRFTIDQCLAHPWLDQKALNVHDSTGGLVGGIAGFEVNRRAPARERILLSSLNSVQVAAQVEVGKDKNPVKVFAKNKGRVTNATKEAGPAHQRVPEEFMELGGKGDQELFANEDGSIYPVAGAASKGKAAGKAKGR